MRFEVGAYLRLVPSLSDARAAAASVAWSDALARRDQFYMTSFGVA
jgi:hypothetical protein